MFNPPQPTASTDNTLLDLHNILHKILMQPHSLIVNYFKKTNLANLMATCIKRGRSSMSLLLINPAGQSGKELSLNGDISIT